MRIDDTKFTAKVKFENKTSISVTSDLDKLLMILLEEKINTIDQNYLYLETE